MSQAKIHSNSEVKSIQVISGNSFPCRFTQHLCSLCSRHMTCTACHTTSANATWNALTSWSFVHYYIIQIYSNSVFFSNAGCFPCLVTENKGFECFCPHSLACDEYIFRLWCVKMFDFKSWCLNCCVWVSFFKKEKRMIKLIWAWN